MANRKVTRIEPLDKLPEMQKIILHKRVAAYVRVSTDHEEQLSSFEAQRDYYEKRIASNPNWEFAGIYLDEGISGVSTKDRVGFNTMIAEALEGKFDLILTKSLSRFARNTVDTLRTIRALKEKNIEVYFEKEDIHTLDSKGELLITLMSSLAQEESRSLSENVTWGKRKRYSDGKYHIAYNSFIGYKAGKDGMPEIDEEEAPLIRFIYLRFLEGWTRGDIARKLDDAKIKTAQGKSQWSISVISSILTNEKYYGAALLQKKYTADYLTKKMVKNNGVLPQYFVENGHPAIISKELFEEVQLTVNFESRPVSKVTPFNEKVTCESCGTFYGRRKWTRADGVYSWVWECPQKYKEPKCDNPHVYEDFMYSGYYDAIKHLYSIYKKDLIEHMKTLGKIIKEDFLLEEFDIFLKMSPCEAFFDKSMWLIMMRKVLVTKDRKLNFEFISGNTFTHTVPDRVVKKEKKKKLIIPKPKETRKCLWCKNEFTVYAKSNQKYCSRECYANSQRKKKEAKKTMTKEIKTIPITRNCKPGYRLTDDDKKIISMYTRQGLGYRKIAKLTGFNLNSLKSLLWRHKNDPFYHPPKNCCLQCGEPLIQIPHKRERKFCSDTCRMKWWNEHRIEINKKAVYTFTCSQCGKEFESYGNANRIYCSRDCYAEARRKKADE